MLEQPRLPCSSLARWGRPPEWASPAAPRPRQATAATPDTTLTTALTTAPPRPAPPRPAPPTQTMGKAKTLPSSQGSSQGKKVVSSAGSSQTGGKRKKLSHSVAAVLKRQGIPNYHIYIHKVLKQVNPTLNISKQSMSIINVSSSTRELLLLLHLALVLLLLP